jgi:hypothetical protein
MRHCISIRIALHKIAMLTPLAVDAATQWHPVILSDDPVSIDGCQPFAGVTPIQPQCKDL